MADENKPTESKSKAVLGSKKSEKDKAARELDSISLEHTHNGMVKATHLYKNDPASEVHALDHKDVINHVRGAFGLGDVKASIDAKKSNVAAYEAEHGSLLGGASAAPKNPAPAVDQYDKIREGIRAKAKQPAAPLDELLSRADKLTK